MVEELMSASEARDLFDTWQKVNGDSVTFDIAIFCEQYGCEHRRYVITTYLGKMRTRFDKRKEKIDYLCDQAADLTRRQDLKGLEDVKDQIKLLTRCTLEEWTKLNESDKFEKLKILMKPDCYRIPDKRKKGSWIVPIYNQKLDKLYNDIEKKVNKLVDIVIPNAPDIIIDNIDKKLLPEIDSDLNRLRPIKSKIKSLFFVINEREKRLTDRKLSLLEGMAKNNPLLGDGKCDSKVDGKADGVSSTDSRTDRDDNKVKGKERDDDISNLEDVIGELEDDIIKNG